MMLCSREQGVNKRKGKVKELRHEVSVAPLRVVFIYLFFFTVQQKIGKRRGGFCVNGECREICGKCTKNDEKG